MKSFLSSVALLFLLSFYACKGNIYPQVLRLADSLVSNNPDSAVSLLRSIKYEMPAQPEEIQMYYHLLCIKAADPLDSVQKLTYSKEISEINALYDYALIEMENNRLRMENRHEHTYLLYSVAGGAVVLLCFFAYFQYSRRKHERLNLQLLYLKQLAKEQYEKSAWFIEKNKKRQKGLPQLFQDGLEERERLRRILLNSDICKYFRKACHTEGGLQIAQEKWLLLEETVNDIYDGFTDKLYHIYQISRHELYICLLIKMHVSPKDMAKLTNHSRESITSTRRRLYEKFFGQQGTPQQWDEFIGSL